MLINRKVSKLVTLSESERKHNEYVYKLYITDKWYYHGGNYGEHYRYFEIISKLSHNSSSKLLPYEKGDICYVCGIKLIWNRIYYIKDYLSNKIERIGRCCFKRFDPNKKIKNDIILQTFNKSRKIKIKTD